MTDVGPGAVSKALSPRQRPATTISIYLSRLLTTVADVLPMLDAMLLRSTPCLGKAQKTTGKK